MKVTWSFHGVVFPGGKKERLLTLTGGLFNECQGGSRQESADPPPPPPNELYFQSIVVSEEGKHVGIYTVSWDERPAYYHEVASPHTDM